VGWTYSHCCEHILKLVDKSDKGGVVDVDPNASTKSTHAPSNWTLYVRWCCGCSHVWRGSGVIKDKWRKLSGERSRFHSLL